MTKPKFGRNHLFAWSSCLVVFGFVLLGSANATMSAPADNTTEAYRLFGEARQAMLAKHTDAAEDYMQQAWQMASQPDVPPQTKQVLLTMWAALSMSEENYARAEKQFRDLIALYRDARESDPEYSQAGIWNNTYLLMAVLIHEHKPADAESVLRTMLAEQEKAPGAPGSSPCSTEYFLGDIALLQKRYPEAEVLMAHSLFSARCKESMAVIPEYRATLGDLRSRYLGQYEEGYIDLKSAADDMRARLRNINPLDTAFAEDQQNFARWIFIDQVEAAWRWSHAP